MDKAVEKDVYDRIISYPLVEKVVFSKIAVGLNPDDSFKEQKTVEVFFYYQPPENLKQNILEILENFRIERNRVKFYPDENRSLDYFDPPL